MADSVTTNKSIDPRLLKLLTETFKLHSQESQYNIKETTVSLPLVEETAQGIEADLLALLPGYQSVPKGNLTSAGEQIRYRALGHNQALKELRKAIRLYCGTSTNREEK